MKQGADQNEHIFPSFSGLYIYLIYKLIQFKILYHKKLNIFDLQTYYSSKYFITKKLKINHIEIFFPILLINLSLSNLIRAS